MRLFLSVVVTAFLLNLIFPWWCIAIPGLVFGYLFGENSYSAFGWGFAALFFLWASQTLYIHIANDAILSSRIADMLGLEAPILLILITAFVGGLVSGLSSLTGCYLKMTVQK